jgi:hypothetical protein
MKLLSHPMQRSVESEIEYNLRALIKSPGGSAQTAPQISIQKTINMEQDQIYD